MEASAHRKRKIAATPRHARMASTEELREWRASARYRLPIGDRRCDGQAEWLGVLRISRSRRQIAARREEERIKRGDASGFSSLF